jgi:hypothetical protein
MILRLLCCVLLTVLFTEIASAFPEGNIFNPSGGGCGCHNANESTTTISDLIPSAKTVRPGGTIDFVMSVKSNIHPKAGFSALIVLSNSTTAAGTWSATEGTRVLQPAFISHSGSKPLNGTEATWSLRWQAPQQTGTYTVYAIGNAVTNAVVGDWKYITPYTITVEQTSSVEVEEEHWHFLSTPISGATTISVPEYFSGGRLSVIAPTGTVVRRFENVSQHTPWDTNDEAGNQLANGMYIVVLDNGRKRYSQPVLIMR